MKSLLTLAFALLAFMPVSHAMEEKTMMEKDAMVSEEAAPKLKAVVFHSDNCGSCKVLGPKMKEAMQAINMDQIEVVRLDFTTKETIEASKALAENENVAGLLQKFGAKTGFVTLLNSDGEIVEKLGKDDTVEDIATKLATSIVKS